MNFPILKLHSSWDGSSISQTMGKNQAVNAKWRRSWTWGSSLAQLMIPAGRPGPVANLANTGRGGSSPFSSSSFSSLLLPPCSSSSFFLPKMEGGAYGGIPWSLGGRGPWSPLAPCRSAPTFGQTESNRLILWSSLNFRYSKSGTDRFLKISKTEPFRSRLLWFSLDYESWSNQSSYC